MKFIPKKKKKGLLSRFWIINTLWHLFDKKKFDKKQEGNGEMRWWNEKFIGKALGGIDNEKADWINILLFQST